MCRCNIILYSVLLLIISCKSPQQPTLYKQPAPIEEEVKEHPANNNLLPVTPADPRLIIPGKSAGLTILNEPLQQVTAQLGQPDASNAAMGKSVSVWHADHNPARNSTSIYATTQMGVEDTSRVKMVRFTSSWFHTATGIHTGSPLDSLQKAYNLARPEMFEKGEQKFRIYKSEAGIAFEVNKQNICTAIIVYAAGSDVADRYLLLHEFTGK